VEHYAGIDVSLERSSVCVVDVLGKIVKEATRASVVVVRQPFSESSGCLIFMTDIFRCDRAWLKQIGETIRF
jgi:hypothetical protein